MGIGAWRRGRVVGRGSSATVSVATALPSGEVFAVKSAELSRSALLQREQRILSSLNSPYVVSCFGFDVSSAAPATGLYYNLFMEYAPGGSLSDEIARRGGRLDVVTIRSLACDMLRGLAYLHSRGVAHCDVKGRNVLIASDGHAKIADFGCARCLAQADDGNGDDEVGGECRRLLKGTPAFMAPEVARGEQQGPPADVWALGCTVIEMATGLPPWPDVSDAVGAIHRIAFSPDVPDFPSWLSREGKDFLSKCLKRDPGERWTAAQLLEHEFVQASSHSQPKPDADHHWVSPKSTLDQAFWASLPDQVEEKEAVQHPPVDDPPARIQQLRTSCSPNWTRDDDWVTVRSNDDEWEAPTDIPADSIAAAAPADDEEIQSSWASRRIDSDDSFYDSHSHGDIVIDGNRDFCDINSCKIESNLCKSDNVLENNEQRIQFEIWYWLFIIIIASILLVVNFCLFPFVAVLSTGWLCTEREMRGRT